MSKKDDPKGPKFPPALLQADKKARRKYFDQLVIRHPLLIESFEEVSTEIQQADPGSLIFVFGPTGAGKSTLAQKVKEQVTADVLAELYEDRGRYPIVMTELWAQDSGNYNLRDLYRGLLDSMREPCIDSKVIIEPGDNDGNWIEIMRKHRKAGPLELRHATLKAIEFRRPGALLIDEAQHLATVTSGRKIHDQLDAIKSLANKAQVPIVLFGTYELLPFRNLSAQLSRRSSDIHLRRYDNNVPAELKAFINVVGTFQQHLPLEQEPDLVANWDYLYERSIGCVGVLKGWLLKAFSRALKQDSPTIEMKHLEGTALSVAQCDKMATEAVEGEGKIKETSRARAMLRSRLNLKPSRSDTHNGQSCRPNQQRKRRGADPSSASRHGIRWGTLIMRRPANYGVWPLFRDNVEPSRLNNREPIGINTSQIESLTSYFTRLSWSHCLSPGSLFSGVIAPLLDKPYLEKRRNRSTWLSRSFRARSAAVNGTGLIAAEWTTVLEQLTGRNDLRSLTLLPWSGMLSQRNLLRPHLAWCALCIQQWSDASLPVYEPLLWSVKLVTRCVNHHVPLITNCPSCRTALHCLAHGRRPGYCHACGIWVGVSMRECRSLERGSSDPDILPAALVGALFANITYLRPSIDNRFSSIIATLIKEVAGNNASHFARLVGRNKSTICDWTHGSRISLDDLLDISERLKTTPVRILAGSGLSVADYVGHSIAKRTPVLRSRNPLNRRRALSRLERVLTYATPPRSVQHVANKLHVDKRVLYKHFPQLCKEIAARAARYRRTKAA